MSRVIGVVVIAVAVVLGVLGEALNVMYDMVRQVQSVW